MIIGRDSEAQVKKLAGVSPAVGIVMPRQVGKTTLVRELLDPGDRRETIYLGLIVPPRSRAPRARRLRRLAFRKPLRGLGRQWGASGAELRVEVSTIALALAYLWLL